MDAMDITSQPNSQNNVKLQHFGSIVVLDKEFTVVGVSESVLTKEYLNTEIILGTYFFESFKEVFGEAISKIKSALTEILENGHSRHILPIKIKKNRIYVKLRIYEGHFHVEWEQQHKKYISAKKINEFNFLLDTIQPNNWDRVCLAINRLLNYDRVFVLKIQETGYSSVIAEHTANGLPFFKGKEFSKDYMPADAISYYRGYSYRYSPNVDADYQNFISINNNIDPLSSLLSPIPDLHKLFLKKINTKSSLFFRICIDGEFWGLVIAQNERERPIDLQQRKLCTFAIQAASSKYESHVKQNLLERNELLNLAEENLKKSLSENKMVNCALVQHMDILTDLVNADGLAIFNQGDVFNYGHAPQKAQFYEIIHFLQQHTDKVLFKDYNFRLNHQINFKDSLNFAGLMYLKVGLENDYYLVWFRKESLSQVMQMDLKSDEYDNLHLKIWDEVRYDVSKPWNDAEINFVLRLNQIIKESIFAKLKERQLLNEELLSLNNELEMFTHTLSHDLKNPLSILKMGIQFLQQHSDDVDFTKMNKWYQNFSRSVSNIEDIINNMVQLSQHRTSALDKEPLPMAYTIKRIFQENSILYNAINCRFYAGQLLPIWGEKSAAYQIFTNIIANAIKYSSNADNPAIEIESSNEEDLIHYRIKDNGIGIPTEHLPHIYEMFSRADNVGPIPGTGIGLSLVKRIMERLGGNIVIESEVGSGTTVHLYFPIVQDFPDHMLHD
ncbi:ATP-binding protein [Sphingobacterium sp.]|uniref:GAF domain-containing sensor histidine kinase n=1 Tax=Sphingobacterium sp. TaxID=341027 RepID=UPI0028A20E30|nr:ATP-binding protein [Sphingobacterium sp.]